MCVVLNPETYERFCFMNVDIGDIVIVKYSNEKWTVMDKGGVRLELQRKGEDFTYTYTKSDIVEVVKKSKK